MKRFWNLVMKVLLLLCMLCLLTGCNKQDEAENTGDTRNVGTTETPGGDTWQEQNVQNHPVAESENNEVLWTNSLGTRTYGREGSFYNESNRVYFLDAATGEADIICDDITCDHKSKECSARFEGVTYTALEDDHLILVTSHGEDYLWNLAVYEADVNGGNRKKLGDFGTMLSVHQMLFMEDKIIASYWNDMDENLEPMDENRASIAIYDRKTNTSKVVWEKQALNAITSDLQYYNDVVYFSVFYFDVTMEEVTQYGERSDFVTDRQRFELHALNLKDGSDTLIHEGDWESFDICQDKVWFADAEGLWSYNIATGEKQKELDKEFMVMQCYVPDKLLLRDKKDYWIYYTYTPGGELIKNGTKAQVITSVAYPELTWAMDYNTPTGNGQVIYWNTAEFMSEGVAVPMQDATPTPSPTPVPTKAPATTPVAEVTKATVNTPAPGEVTVITWVMPDIMREEEVAGNVERLNQKLWEDGYKLALKIKTFPMTTYRNAVVSMLEAGEADIVSVGLDMANGSIGYAQDFIRIGYLEDLSDYLASDKGSRLFDWYTEPEWKRVEVDGKKYVVPWQSNTYGSGYVAFNKAYVTEEMIKDFTGTPQELEQLLSSIEIPEGVHGILGSYSQSELAVLCDMYSEEGVFFDLETGVVENPFENQEFYAMLKALNTMFQSGLVKVFTGFSMEDREGQAVKDGKFVAWISYGQDETYESVKDSVITVPLAFSVPSGLSTSRGINKASSHKEEALELLTLLYTEATYGNLLAYGEEGVDYYLEDGYVTLADGTQKYSNRAGLAFGMSDLLHPVRNDAIKTNRREIINERFASENYRESAILGFQADFTVFAGGVPKAVSVLEDYYNIWQESDFDTAWQQAAKEFKDAGGEELVAELNRQVVEWMNLYR